METRARVAALFAALVLLVAACTGDGPATTSTQPSQPSVTGEPSTAPGTSVGTTTTTAVTTPATFPESEAALRAEIARLIAETEEVRGLPFLLPPTVAIVSSAELARRVAEDIEEQSEDLRDDDALFTLLGLLDPGIDLEALLSELLQEQVLGFYDGDTKELVIAGEQEELSELSVLTVVHELIHALTDQHFDFDARGDLLWEQQRYDELAALRALIEGDATYFQIVYLQEKMTFAQQSNLALEILGTDTTVLDASPEFLKADLAFAYDDGFRFVERLVAAGGSAAVDGAYENPPTTTEQILDPDRFLAGEEGIEVALPPTPIAGYEPTEESSLGQWGLQLLFTGNDDAGLISQVGDGWGGAAYRVLFNGVDVAMVARYVADRDVDAVEVADALVRLAENSMGLGPGVEENGTFLFQAEDAYAYIARSGPRLLFVVADDPGVGAELRRLVGAP